MKVWTDTASLSTLPEEGCSWSSDNNEHDQLSLTLAEVHDQRCLLDLAARNGKLLAEKYFQVERERNDAHAQLGDLQQRQSQRDREVAALWLEKQKLVQKCIDGEHQVASLSHQSQSLVERIRRLENERMRWRATSASLREDNARLRDAVESSIAEERSWRHVQKQDAAARHALADERNRLHESTMALELLLMQARQDEHKWANTSKLQQSRIHGLERTLSQVQHVLRLFLARMVQTQAIRRARRPSPVPVPSRTIASPHTPSFPLGLALLCIFCASSGAMSWRRWLPRSASLDKLWPMLLWNALLSVMPCAEEDKTSP